MAKKMEDIILQNTTMSNDSVNSLRQQPSEKIRILSINWTEPFQGRPLTWTNKNHADLLYKTLVVGLPS